MSGARRLIACAAGRGRPAPRGRSRRSRAGPSGSRASIRPPRIPAASTGGHARLREIADVRRRALVRGRACLLARAGDADVGSARLLPAPWFRRRGWRRGHLCCRTHRSRTHRTRTCWERRSLCRTRMTSCTRRRRRRNCRSSRERASCSSLRRRRIRGSSLSAHAARVTARHRRADVARARGARGAVAHRGRARRAGRRSRACPVVRCGRSGHRRAGPDGAGEIAGLARPGARAVAAHSIRAEGARARPTFAAHRSVRVLGHARVRVAVGRAHAVRVASAAGRAQSGDAQISSRTRLRPRSRCTFRSRCTRRRPPCCRSRTCWGRTICLPGNKGCGAGAVALSICSARLGVDGAGVLVRVGVAAGGQAGAVRGGRGSPWLLKRCGASVASRGARGVAAEPVDAVAARAAPAAGRVAVAPRCGVAGQSLGLARHARAGGVAVVGRQAVDVRGARRRRAGGVDPVAGEPVSAGGFAGVAGRRDSAPAVGRCADEAAQTSAGAGARRIAAVSVHAATAGELAGRARARGARLSGLQAARAVGGVANLRPGALSGVLGVPDGGARAVRRLAGLASTRTRRGAADARVGVADAARAVVAGGAARARSRDGEDLGRGQGLDRQETTRYEHRARG